MNYSNNKKTNSTSRKVPRASRRGRPSMIQLPSEGVVFAKPINKAWKFIDTSVAPINVGITPTVNNFNMPSIGTGTNSRIGDRIIIKAIECRETYSGANVDVLNRVRSTKFLYKQNTTFVSPTGFTIYDDPSTAGVLTAANFYREPEYYIYYDKLFKLIGTATNPTTDSLKDFVYRITPPAVVTYFEPGADSGTNIPHFSDFSDSAVTPFPIKSAQYRVYFIDA